MAITTYSDISAAGLIEGMIYSEPGATVCLTGFNAETSAIIPAGFAVVRAATSVAEMDRTSIPLELPADSGDTFAGFAVLPKGLEKRTGYSLNSDSRFGYPIDYEVAYMVKGIIAVPVDDTVAYGDPVFWRHTAAGDERVGMFRMDADTADAVQIGSIDTCRFISEAVGTAASPAIALVSSNIA